MEIVEMIHLRLARDSTESLGQIVCSSIGPDTVAGSIRVYRHSQLDTDLLVQLHRVADEVNIRSSDVGDRLASVLKDYGIVAHSVWVEQPKTENE